MFPPLGDCQGPTQFLKPASIALLSFIGESDQAALQFSR
jgi:hypothetical protein